MLQQSGGRDPLPEAVVVGLLAASWTRRAAAGSRRPLRAAALSEEARLVPGWCCLAGGEQKTWCFGPPRPRLVSALRRRRTKDVVFRTPQAAAWGPCCGLGCGWGGAERRKEELALPRIQAQDFARAPP
ncbi:hypothetical protein NDU88_006075 [Pleurodeles waltl]|uniref:Secreted protein n=1 Tax=Pleurodeles waltl TaxID=8319 RepID=A0AAV7SNJ3_PLEWA|nr:hypothetical protein NDU88_006075 [Pleurodeles waltl]